MTHTFRAQRGVTFSHQLQYKHPDGTAVNLAGCQLKMRVQLEDWKHDVSVTIDDEDSGLFTITIPAADMLEFPLFSPPCFYDIIFTDTNQRVKVILEGDFVVTKEPISLD